MKPFYSGRRISFVMFLSRPPGIEAGAFVFSPEIIGYARISLLFSALTKTDKGLSHSTEHWSRRLKPLTITNTAITVIMYAVVVIAVLCVIEFIAIVLMVFVIFDLSGWLGSFS